MPETTEDHDARFHPTDEADVVAYRSLSKAAIVAIILGVASFGALLQPLLLIVPLVAIVAGILALRSISVSTAGLAGRWLAVIGVLLAVFFASTATARFISRDWIVTARARRFADDWLQMAAEGRREEAYEMTLSPAQRQLPGTELAEFYASSAERNEELQQFFAESPARDLVEYGSQGTLQFEEVIHSGKSSYYGDMVGMIYTLTYTADDETKAVKIHLIVRRSRHRKSGHGQWSVEHVGDPKDVEDL
jgi:hypothetical protein